MDVVDTVAGRAVAAGLCLPGGWDGELGDVLAAAVGALGMPDPQARAARERFGLPSVSRVVVVLVDGLGRRNLEERAGHAPFLRGLLPGSPTLGSSFPSTTASALGSFGTGRPPGQTAMLGYTVRDPATGLLGNLVTWTNLPDPASWQRTPTWFERARAAGLEVTSLGLQRFDGSGLTQAVLRGAQFRAAGTPAGRVDAALAALRRPGLAYLYWGEVDKAGHHHGWGSPRWADELAAVDAELGRLARSLPRDTLMLVTADHGMVDVDLRLRWDVAGDPALSEQVALVAGEPRAMQVHLVPGADPDRVAARWTQVLGPHALVTTRDEAVAAGLFGEVAEHVRPVIGDVVVAMSGRATVVDSTTQTPASIGLLGVHGSLTEQELAVPLLVEGR